MTFSEFYKYSWFANMAYVLWNEENTQDKSTMINAANDAERIPTLLANFIFNQQTENWKVSSFQQNDHFGFAANIFEKEGTNEKVLAIRGTEGGGTLEQLYLDLLKADFLEIGGVGLAISQAVSLFNYVQRLKANENDNSVLQLELISITRPSIFPSPVPDGTQSVSITNLTSIPPTLQTTYYWFETNNNGQGLGILNETDQVTVTGDSLGGHLAALALRLFPQLFDQAVTFSSPGFDPLISLDGLGGQKTDEFVGLFSEYLTSPPAATFAELSPRLYTLESEDSVPGDDTDIVSSIITGQAASEETFIRVEKVSHAMDQFMDGLAIHTLIESLNPQLTNNEIFALYDAISILPRNTEEKYVEALSKLFLNNDTKLDIAEANLVSAGSFEGK